MSRVGEYYRELEEMNPYCEPMPMHCVECDKPIMEGLVCGRCQEVLDGRMCPTCNQIDNCLCREEEDESNT